MAFASMKNVTNENKFGLARNIASKRDFSHPDILKVPKYKYRRTPIMATICDPKITIVDLQNMIEAGLNIIKLKLAGSTKMDKIKILEKIQKASEYLSSKYNIPEWPVASCLSLKTSLVKTGMLQKHVSELSITTGSVVMLTNKIALYDQCNKRQIFVDNKHLTIEVDIGMEITLVTNNEIILKCTGKIDKNTLKCVVTKGGHLNDMSTVIVRGIKRIESLLTKQDMELLKFAVEYKVDILVINYVQTSEPLKRIKNFFGKEAQRPILLSYLSTPEDILHFKDILKESDGVLFSRDFLPYELDVSKRLRWIQIQKWVSSQCLQAGKPLFISGAVLQNTCLKEVVYDNEISDVANALLDGATGFVLKDWHNIETLVDGIKLLSNVCRNVSPFTMSFPSFLRLVDEIKLPVNAAEASMIACVTAAFQTFTSIIILPTVTGKTAKLMCRLQPPCLVIVLTNKTWIARMLHTYSGFLPLKYEWQHKITDDDIENRIQYAVEFAVARRFLKYNDTFVTLRRGTHISMYCDTVDIRTVTIPRTLLNCQ